MNTRTGNWWRCAALAAVIGSPAMAQSMDTTAGTLTHSQLVPVNIDNFIRAASDIELDRYAALGGGVNTFFHFLEPVDVTDPDDVAAAQAAQDAIVVSGSGTGLFEAPNWNTEQLAIARQATSDLALLGSDSARAFGRTKDDVDPVRFLVGALSGWGGLPGEAAIYQLGVVDDNDGGTAHAVTVEDVPVRAFWSVTVRNSAGRLEANELGVNRFNGYAAEAAEDGSVTLHSGGCDDGRVNCVPITPGWVFAIRLHEAEESILDGSGTFPPIEPAN